MDFQGLLRYNRHPQKITKGEMPMKGEYLSKIVEVEDLQPGKLNLIEAPCGCGKTTFAKTKLKELNEDYCDPFFQPELLYLIDTAMGKEQLINSKGAKLEYSYWSDDPYWKLPGITVMTYAGYETLCEKAPKYNEWINKCVIVCDELQEEIQWSKWKKDDNLHTQAVGRIANIIEMTENIVVALSATPDWIKKEFAWCLNEVKLLGEPRHYENEHVEEYNNLSLLLDKVKPNECGIIYISQIKDMIKYENLLKSRGIKCISLWSKNSKTFPLTEEQTRIRNYIIKHKELPPYIDVLIINRACATSITIGDEEHTKKPIDFMIIHTGDKNIQIQARGRYRNDLKKLYLHKTDIFETIKLPPEWLDVPLYKEDKDKLCRKLSLKNEKGRLLKWTSIKTRLEKNGYIVMDNRTNKARYSIIYDI